MTDELVPQTPAVSTLVDANGVDTVVSNLPAVGTLEEHTQEQNEFGLSLTAAEHELVKEFLRHEQRELKALQDQFGTLIPQGMRYPHVSTLLNESWTENVWKWLCFHWSAAPKHLESMNATEVRSYLMTWLCGTIQSASKVMVTNVVKWRGAYDAKVNELRSKAAQVTEREEVVNRNKCILAEWKAKVEQYSSLNFTYESQIVELRKSLQEADDVNEDWQQQYSRCSAYNVTLEAQLVALKEQLHNLERRLSGSQAEVSRVDHDGQQDSGSRERLDLAVGLLDLMEANGYRVMRDENSQDNGQIEPLEEVSARDAKRASVTFKFDEDEKRGDEDESDLWSGIGESLDAIQIPDLTSTIKKEPNVMFTPRIEVQRRSEATFAEMKVDRIGATGGVRKLSGTGNARVQPAQYRVKQADPGKGAAGENFNRNQGSWQQRLSDRNHSSQQFNAGHDMTDVSHIGTSGTGNSALREATVTYEVAAQRDMKLHKFLFHGKTAQQRRFDGQRYNYYGWRDQLVTFLESNVVSDDCPWVINQIRVNLLTRPGQQTLNNEFRDKSKDLMRTQTQFFKYMDSAFGGSHRFDEVCDRLLNFRTKPSTEPGQIVFNFKAAVAEMEKQYSFAQMCDTQTFTTTKPKEERLVKALVDSLSGQMRIQMLKAKVSTLERAYEELESMKDWWRVKSAPKGKDWKGKHVRSDKGYRKPGYQGKNWKLQPKPTQGQSNGQRAATKPTYDMSKMKCVNCNGFGHKAIDCRRPKRQGGTGGSKWKYQESKRPQEKLAVMSSQGPKRPAYGRIQSVRSGVENLLLPMEEQKSSQEESLGVVDGIDVVNTGHIPATYVDVVVDTGENIRVMVDGGATLSCVRTSIARDGKCPFGKLIKKSGRISRVATGKGECLLRHYMPLRIRCKDRPKDRPRLVQFWLVDDLPTDWLIGRKDLANIGKFQPLVDIEEMGKQFVHKATDDMLDLDNSEAFVARIDPPPGLELDVPVALNDSDTVDEAQEIIDSLERKSESAEHLLLMTPPLKHERYYSNDGNRFNGGFVQVLLTLLTCLSMVMTPVIGNIADPIIAAETDELIAENQSLMANGAFDIGKYPNAQMKIDLEPNATPVKCKGFPCNPKHAAEINRQVEELVKHDIIEPCDSPWAARTLLAKKKDNTWRMCMDYRPLKFECSNDPR